MYSETTKSYIDCSVNVKKILEMLSGINNELFEMYTLQEEHSLLTDR